MAAIRSTGRSDGNSVIQTCQHANDDSRFYPLAQYELHQRIHAVHRTTSIPMTAHADGRASVTEFDRNGALHELGDNMENGTGIWS